MNAPSSRLPADHEARMERARLALDGLSVGDAFGQRFFTPASVESLIEQRAFPQPPWPYTDDTEMALGITEVLERYGCIDQSDLAETFGRRYLRNPSRGYGGAAHHILQTLAMGFAWQSAARQVFDGQGSMGNGGAMRVAPVGGYFADNFEFAAAAARASAEVTHAHPEGQAGAAAVAVAAAWAWRVASGQETRNPERLFEVALDHTTPGETRRAIEQARALGLDASPITAARFLGSGLRVLSQDTVPFCLWCAARHLDNFEDALWTTVAGLGDRDTTCAIVGGIVALSAGPGCIPAEWLQAREPLRLRG